MSLDVYLYGQRTKHVGTGFFVRENGEQRELTTDEVFERFPNYEPQEVEAERDYGFHANITHNLGKMAGEAGIYEALWRPQEIGITVASQLIEPLKAGLALLLSDPARFKALGPKNGWGTYDGLCGFVSNYIQACVDDPDALIEVSR